ncbi:PEBP-like protein [Rhizodiscina lignyota]|uniref:PEBP-like protein n=1 Tax=Rhizodiscina lignyota TaxID=1504668 RepID=A0A9P4M918_9PEZI|nr:PEBP-like protein [Rhizodiscina lignyota]
MSAYPQLQKHKIIPDVLPEGVDLPSELVVKWPNANLDTPGDQLDRQGTQTEPTVYVKPPAPDKYDDYVLIMTDPDLMSTNDTKFGQVRHWLAGKISIKEDGQLVIPTAGNVSHYIGPAPLPNPKRPHRYVFILCRARTTNLAPITIDKADLRATQSDYPAAFEGRQEVQDLKDRWGFNAYKFMEMKGLVPVAATFMLVGGNLKSAAENLGMTAKAGVDKILKI